MLGRDMLGSLESLLRGAIDAHIHPYPEVVDRKLDVFELGKLSEEYGIEGLVIKSNSAPTSTLAWALNRIFERVRFYGSVVLNLESVGGLNPRAVEVHAKLGAKVIWMPTLSAENHVRALRELIKREPSAAEGMPRAFKMALERGGANLRVARNGRVVEEVEEILHVIAEYDLVLATGHISMEEVVTLVDAAREMGIRRIVITHPSFSLTRIPVDDQKELAKKGAYIEHCYFALITPLDPPSPGDIAKQIRAVGAEHCILSSDLGQPKNPYPHEGLLEFARRLLAEGITEQEIRTMIVENPRKLLE